MGLEAIFTLGVVVLILGCLLFSRVSPDIVFAGGLTLLLLAGVLTPSEALAGFANQGVAVVGVLYIVAAGLRETGGVHLLAQQFLGPVRSLGEAQLRLMVPVTVMSAFLNNTPIVAMLIPAVSDWSKKRGLMASKLMLPLSYAAILGGTCTLIGTSTNLVVNGLLIEEDEALALGIFDLAWVGVPTALVGLVFILGFGRWLLPHRRSARSALENPREYSLEMVVSAQGPLVGKTIESAGLRHLEGLYLIEIERKDKLLTAVAPSETLQADDRLVFVGIIESVVDLQRVRGLAPATEQVFKLDTPRPQRSLVEAVVSDSCPVAGQSIRRGRFRNRYDAVVIAVARSGERLKKKIGDIELRPGDTLLLETGPSFVAQQRNSKDFFLVSSVEDSSPLRFERTLSAVLIMLGMVALSALGILSLFKAALLAAGLMILTRCLSGAAARRSVDWSVLVTIAAAFGIGQALETSGAAQGLATSLSVLAGESPYLNLIALYAATALASSVITNNAAAALMFPVALALSERLGVALQPFAVTIMMAASASFATPLGYQTNLMVYGPGGYRFSDYLRIGVPLNLVTMLVAALVIPLVWRFS